MKIFKRERHLLQQYIVPWVSNMIHVELMMNLISKSPTWGRKWLKQLALESELKKKNEIRRLTNFPLSQTWRCPHTRVCVSLCVRPRENVRGIVACPRGLQKSHISQNTWVKYSGYIVNSQSVLSAGHIPSRLMVGQHRESRMLPPDRGDTCLDGWQ